MFNDFGNAPTDQGGPTGEVIPAGTLAWANVTVRPHNLDHGLVLTPSKNTEGNAYLDVELTILDGPFARRKVWDIIMLKSTGEKAEKTMGMAMAKVRHILEVGREIDGFSATDAKYRLGQTSGTNGEMVLMELNELRCAIKIGVELGSKKYPQDPSNNERYPDKNRVAAYLSPNPASDTFNTFMKLVNGDTAAPATPAPSPAKAAPAAAPSWAQKPGAASAARPASPPAGRPSWAGAAPAASKTEDDKIPF